MPEVLFTESIRERLRPITVRILKYAFACYTVLPECDCADSASEGPSSGCAACHNSEHKGMRQFYDMLVDTTMIMYVAATVVLVQRRTLSEPRISLVCEISSTNAAWMYARPSSIAQHTTLVPISSQMDFSDA